MRRGAEPRFVAQHGGAFAAGEQGLTHRSGGGDEGKAAVAGHALGVEDGSGKPFAVHTFDRVAPDLPHSADAGANAGVDAGVDAGANAGVDAPHAPMLCDVWAVVPACDVVG